MTNVKMTKTAINKFVRLWKKEFEAVKLGHKLDKDLEFAYALDRPTKAIENKIATQEKKASAAYNEIMQMVIDGLIGEDAPAQCSEVLDELQGYVADCYHDAYQDALVEMERNGGSL